MDTYSLKARTYPVALVFMPILIIGIAYSVQYEEIGQMLASLGVTGALSYFLANFGRDQGKTKEKRLWDSWGGSPTSQLFSINNGHIDKITKQRYYTIMSEVAI